VPLPADGVFGSGSFGLHLAWRGHGDGELLLPGARRSGPRTEGIFGIRPDGTGFRDIGRFDMEHAGVSPDGRWLSYFKYLLDGGQISGAQTHLVDLATGEDRVLSSGRVGWDQELAFSPDGRTGVMVACETWAECNLVIVSLDGSTLPRVIARIGGPTPKERRVFYSPDGRTIVTVEDGASRLIDVESGALEILDYSVEAWLPVPVPSS
jgi:WD40 repeat protein